MNTPLVFDPFVPPAVVSESGAKAVSLDELLTQSDFVSLHCPLNEHTRNLLSARELSLMKPTAYLLNTARGGIAEEDALFAALSEHRIAGAASIVLWMNRSCRRRAGPSWTMCYSRRIRSRGPTSCSATSAERPAGGCSTWRPDVARVAS